MVSFMKKIFILLIVLALPVQAEENSTRLVTSLVSYHFDRDKYSTGDHCEVNPGIGAEHFVNDKGYYGGGVYRNSNCDISVYAGGGLETNRSNRWGAGFFVGLVSGYDSDDFPTSPVIAYPYLRIGGKDNLVNAKILVIPAESGLIALSLTWRL